MGFRYRKSIKAGPFRVNISKSGVGYSVGGKGFRYTKKANGGTRTTYSIPGTGISYVEETGAKKNNVSKNKPITVNATYSPRNSKTATENIPGYCKHCYRKIDDYVIVCPACGKSQTEQAAPTPLNKKAVWSTVCLIIGLCCILANPFIALLFLCLTIYFSVGMLKDKKATQNAPAQGSFCVTHVQHTTDAIASDPPSQEQIVSGDALNPLSQSPEIAPNLNTLPVSDILAPASKTKDKSFTAKVTGMQYRLDNLLNLAVDNPDYDMSKKEIIDNGMTDEKIWQYEFDVSKVELVPEPENPHDNDAVKVIVDGEHVGYIKAGSCKRILKLLRENRIQDIDCAIGGGKYKILYEEDDDTYTLEWDSINYFVHLTIHEKLTNTD